MKLAWKIRGRVLLFAGAFIVLSACNRSDEGNLKGPATVEEAAAVMDLTQAPVLEGALENQTRTVSNLTYELSRGDIQSVFDSYRKDLKNRGWKETTRDT